MPPNAMSLGMGAYLGSAALLGNSGGGGPFRVTDSVLGAGGLDYAMFDSSPSAYDRMWQESTGQTPAALASPVGLLLDRGKQAAKTFAQVMAGQPQIVPNNDFTDGLNGWLVNASFPNTVTVEAGGARIITDGTNTGITATVPTTTGKLLMATIVVAAVVSGGLNFAGDGGVVIGTAMTAPGTYTRFYFAAKNSERAEVKRNSGATNVLVRSVSVKEVSARCASQASAGARPVLQSDGWKYDGSDDNHLTDWLAQAGANCILAKISAPASIAATQVIAGHLDSATTYCMLGLSAAGTVRIAVGSNVANYGPDIRGQSAVVGVSFNAGSGKVFVNDSDFDFTYTGTPSTSLPFRLGAGTTVGLGATSFFSGASDLVSLSRTALTPAQFQQIRAEWLAAA